MSDDKFSNRTFDSRNFSQPVNLTGKKNPVHESRVTHKFNQCDEEIFDPQQNRVRSAWFVAQNKSKMMKAEAFGPTPVVRESPGYLDCAA